MGSSSVVINFYLAVDASGRIRVFKQSPSLHRNEIAIKLRLELPAALFEQPVLQAKIRIDENAVKPVEISPEVLISAQDLIRRETGLLVEFVPLPVSEKEGLQIDGGRERL